MSLFHFHKFGVYMPLDQPVSRPETHVLYRCKCGKVKTENIKGHWETEVLRGALTGEKR